MLGEGKDLDYKPTRKTVRTDKEGRRLPDRRVNRRVDYTEVELVSSGSDTVTESESGIGSVNLRRVR